VTRIGSSITVDVREVGRPARTAGVSRHFASAPANKFLIVFLVAGLLFEMDAFRMQLSGNDPGLPIDRNAASLVVQILTGSIIVVACGLLLCSHRTSEMALGTWPIFAMPAMAFVSMLWSPDPEYTLRKSVAFTAAVLIGFLVATVLSTKDSIRMLGRVLSAVIVLSVVWVYLFPQYGVHNAADNAETLLIGNWRGVFSHRTGLGHVAGLTTVFLVFYGRYIWSSRIVRYGIVVLSVTCLIKADSGGGLLTLTCGALALLFSQALIKMKPAVRGSAFFLMLLAVLPLILFAPQLLKTLLAVLGKDSDLTGRIPLWDALLVLAQVHPLLGFGYAAGYIYEVQPRVLAATGYAYAHCHNGYLEVLIAFGYVGLGICFAVIIWLLTAAGRLVVAPPTHLGHLSGLPFVIVMYALGANCIESFLITESCYAVVLLAVAASLATRARLEVRELRSDFRRGVDNV
jgi:exopolysaccharide production protein ExoQ